MREKDYVVIIGSANIDVAGYSHESLNYADSNPGKIKFTPGGVGRNIAQNLALLGNKSWLLSAVGSDFYGQSLLTQTNQSGVYVDKCLIVPGENTSSYLSLLDNIQAEISMKKYQLNHCQSEDKTRTKITKKAIFSRLILFIIFNTHIIR